VDAATAAATPGTCRCASPPASIPQSPFPARQATSAAAGLWDRGNDNARGCGGGARSTISVMMACTSNRALLAGARICTDVFLFFSPKILVHMRYVSGYGPWFILITTEAEIDAVPILQYLHARSCDPTARDDKGYTPLNNIKEFGTSVDPSWRGYLYLIWSLTSGGALLAF
jgi:hypothetical protein